MVQEIELNLENDLSVQFGRYLAHPPPGEEIAISGISGAFPLCANIDEFKQNLDTKKEMITFSDKTHPELPMGIGYLKNDTAKRFDRGFFDIHKRHSLPMTNMIKMMLEKSYEAIFDAGLNPADLKGTRTGVFMGICFSESECYWFGKDLLEGANTMLGNLKSICANRVSQHLQLQGPSIVADTACSSSAYALENAYKSLRMGECDMALVGGVNTILSNGATLQFARLGVLSLDGHCRPFDKDGDGYVRAEAATVLLLQKAKDCKRIYAQLIHTKTNCDGFKEQGITYPNGIAQFNLLKEIYLESGVDPKDVSYIEAHGTGTTVGDPEELNSVDDFFTVGRDSPLLVGSVKSSIGHSEAASVLCSAIKVILAFENGYITPNINYYTPRDNLKGVLEGRLEIVSEKTPFRDDNGLAGLSSFGFGGGNAHALLKRNEKTKTKFELTGNLPVLVCVSGRTKTAVEVLLEDVARHSDSEHIALIHNIFRKGINNHLYRGYVVISKMGVLKTSVTAYDPRKSNVCLYFGNLLKMSKNLFNDIFNLPCLANFQNSLRQFFAKKQMDFNEMLADSTSFLASFIAQLMLAECFKQLELNFQSTQGCSLGKFAAAYFQKCLTVEECLECGYVLSKIVGNGVKNISKFEDELLAHFKNILPATAKGYNGSNVLTPQYFLQTADNEQQISNIPKKSIVLQIGGNATDFKQQTIYLTNLTDILELLDTLGILYEYGLDVQIQKLYPQVEFPVSRGTPMISPKIKWKHDFEHFIPSFKHSLQNHNVMVFSIDPSNEEWISLQGHVIDGRNLFPATGYLYLVWTVFYNCTFIDQNKLKVVFTNCKFLRACTIPKPKTSFIDLRVMLQMESGNFEITEGDVLVVTGHVEICNDNLQSDLNCLNDDNDLILNQKDIYKEFRLRGYNYKGLFKSLTKCNRSATLGKIQWANDWIAFLDNMLQIKILGEDTRLLYVPTSIARFSIDPEKHLQEINTLRGADEDATVELPIWVDKLSGCIRSGGVEIRGLLASSLPRKKYTALPILEKYLFIPNEANVLLEQSVRVMMQVALENNCGLKVKAVELVDEATKEDAPLIGPLIQSALEDQPLVHTDLVILSDRELEVNVNVENKKLKSETDCTVVVGSNIISRNVVFEEALSAVKETGFIISRESYDFPNSFRLPKNITVLNIFTSTNEKLIFLRKLPQTTYSRVFINIKANQFGWLETLKEATKKEQDVVAWCQDEPLNGIIGLINCVRREPDGTNVRSLFIVDKAPDFDPNLPFYKTQLDKNMSVNVFMNGQWGTYRHLLIDNMEEVESEHCFANSTTRGDLSSIKWLEGPLTRQLQPTGKNYLVDIYYSSLNFKDVMTASGKLNVDASTRNRRKQECVQGFEFSGKTLSGARVMGMVSQGALATLVKADHNLLWKVPDDWSLKEAATVPVVYATCLYAFVVVGKIKRSDTVLIHSGTGGIGQAAINLCLNMGCKVFTTVGTEEKKKFIGQNFPTINERHIGNSRDLTFEQMIMKETQGRGVDIILNSLAEEKLRASVRCLAKNGKFLEIGKFDLANDNHLNLLSFREGGSYHGIMLDQLFNETDEVKRELNVLVQTYLDSGAIKPLKQTIFEKSQLEQAYRFMTTGKHMGKVLVEIKDENVSNHNFLSKGLPRYFCDQSKTYIICGGLGGFGLELADWLVLRGAQNLVLTSRKGISTGYQSYRIGIWRSYGCNIEVSTKDITTKEGCVELIKQASRLAPVAAIFNLAVVLRDAILVNQNETSFEESFGPKARATEYLDEVSRSSCPELRDFVVFSSVSCGRGNAGQPNYGMSNSVMERICEQRRSEGYPALAIQWGAIGDVGLVAEMQEEYKELEIGGTLQQSISNCLQVMDTLLRQKEAAIVSSIVVAEKKQATSGNIMEVVCGILGIRDMKSVSMYSTLAELGMDSMTGVEVKQTLEREYNIFLSPSEMRSITLIRIQEIYEEKNSSAVQEQEDVLYMTKTLKYLLDTEQAETCLVQLRSKTSTTDMKVLPKIIAFPGFEGVCQVLQNLTEMLEVQAFGINYVSTLQQDNFPLMADLLLPHIQKLLRPKEDFQILAHSLGCNVALEVVSRLEKLGHSGTITFMDGSPILLSHLLDLASGSQLESLDNILLAKVLKIQLKNEEVLCLMEEIVKCTCLDEKIKILQSNPTLNKNMILEFFANGFTAMLKRLKACHNYRPDIGKLKSKAYLYKPTFASIKCQADDYELGQYFEQPLEIKVFDGTHLTILENKELAEDIMNRLVVANGFTEI